MTLDEYANVQISSTEDQLLESNATALADLPGQQMVFTNLGLKTMQIWTTKDEKPYTITKYCRRGRLPNDLQVTQRIVRSFEIIEQ